MYHRHASFLKILKSKYATVGVNGFVEQMRGEKNRYITDVAVEVDSCKCRQTLPPKPARTAGGGLIMLSSEHGKRCRK